jgi:hypothetical protein
MNMSSAVSLLAALLAVPTAAQHAASQNPPHDHAMMARGQQAMGFDQQATVHHFLLQASGGAIEITAKDGKDTASVASIRTHLQHIQGAFGKGDFSLPMFIHGAEPPGAGVLRARRDRLEYRFEEIPDGGRLRIRTSDREALEALHAFLRYQITEHKTGDPLEPK